MKKSLFWILITSFLFTACGEEPGDAIIQTEAPEATEQDSIRTVEGDFIYLSDAAVLKGHDFIYGVEVDSSALELAERIKPLKNDDFDMVPVTLKVKILPNPRNQGWDEVAKIIEILKIPEATSDSIMPSAEKILENP